MKNKLTIEKQKKAGRRILASAARYIVLIAIGFVYLMPIISMLLNSFLSPGDQADPTVTWWPTELYFGNYKQAWQTLDFLHSFGTSLLTSVVPTLLQTANCRLRLCAF